MTALQGPISGTAAPVGWYKSSYSGAQNECVEVARLDAGVGIRDSKRATGPALVVPVDAFTRFVAHVAA